MEASVVKDALDYDSKSGVMIWKKVSPYHSEKNGCEAGTLTRNRNGKSYHVISIGGRKYKRSRLAYAWMTGRWPAHQVDHRNGDSSDDRWDNLREATPTQNAWNHKRRARRINLPMGVRNMASGRYEARISYHGIQFHLGAFDTPEQASAAYLAKRKELYREFA